MFLQFYIKDNECYKIGAVKIETLTEIHVSKSLDKILLAQDHGSFPFQFEDRDTTLKVYYAFLEAMQGKEVDLGEIGDIKTFKEVL
jgi:hypothetical protein